MSPRRLGQKASTSSRSDAGTAHFSRVVPGIATLQRGFWSRAGARRSQGEGTGAGLTKWTSRLTVYVYKHRPLAARKPDVYLRYGCDIPVMSPGAHFGILGLSVTPYVPHRHIGPLAACRHQTEGSSYALYFR